MALRHTGEPCHIGIGVAVVHAEQTSVAYLGGLECAFIHTFAVAVAGMAVYARRAYVGRTEAATGACRVGHEWFLKNGFSILELLIHAAVLYGRSRLFECVGCGEIGGAELSAGIVPLWFFLFSVYSCAVGDFVIGTSPQGRCHEGCPKQTCCECLHRYQLTVCII